MEITLQKATISDMPLYVKWRNLDSVRRYYIYQEDFTLSGQEKWYGDNVLTGKAVIYLIMSVIDNAPVGITFIKDIDRIEKTGEYGIFLGDDAPRGQGIGTMAARLTVALAFGELGLSRLDLRVLSDNKRAIASYERAGFIIDEAKGYTAMAGGIAQSVICMSVKK